MTDDTKAGERFTAKMPQIPGVANPPPREDATGEETPKIPAAKLAGPIVAVVVLGAVAAWFVLHTPRRLPVVSRKAAESSRTSAAPEKVNLPAAPPSASTDGTVVVATLSELAGTWSSKPFTFPSRLGTGRVPAIAVRLPGPANKPASYWAFSLQEPYGKCELEFVADLGRLASLYGFDARHPMVGNPCNSTLYDPLKLGTIPNGAWARGEVVRGNGIRPPISIELRIQGDQIIATQIE